MVEGGGWVRCGGFRCFAKFVSYEAIFTTLAIPIIRKISSLRGREEMAGMAMGIWV